MGTETAKAFWTGQKNYPFNFTKLRRLYELNWLVPKLNQLKDKRLLLDLGCGDGSLLNCLLHLTDFDSYYGFDLSPDLLKSVNPNVATMVWDFTQPTLLPTVSATIIAGVIQYVFDDEQASEALAHVTSPVVYIRSSCTLKADDEEVVRDGYASKYRTLPNTLALIGRHFKVTGYERIYPDHADSPYGTKQFYFEGWRV